MLIILPLDFFFMDIITETDDIFYFCNKENNEKDKDNVPDEYISYFGWSNNINLDFGSYIRGYKYAAEATYKEFRNCNGLNYIQDTICFPLVFLYRHIVELYLKYAYIEIKKRSKQEIVQLIKLSHDLNKIWAILKPDIISLSQRINLKVNISAIEHYITSISNEDIMSFNYRYPIKNNAEVIHDKRSYLNVKNLHDKMNLFYNYFENMINSLKDQLFYLEYNEEFNKCFLDELENSLDIINEYIELRERLDSEERENEKHITKAWMSMTDILNENIKGKKGIYEFVNKLTENQKSVLILLYITGSDINYYNEKLAYDKKEYIKDIFRLIYSNVSYEITIDDKSNPYKDCKLYDYLFGRKNSIKYLKNTLLSLKESKYLLTF